MNHYEDPWEFEHSQTRENRSTSAFLGVYPIARRYLVRRVCPQCDGTGTSSLHLGVISQETMEDDPDFMEQYMAGAYDRICDSCQGKNVVEVLDVEAMPEELREEYEQWMESSYETDAICRQERMMGA